MLTVFVERPGGTSFGFPAQLLGLVRERTRVGAHVVLAAQFATKILVNLLLGEWLQVWCYPSV